MRRARWPLVVVLAATITGCGDDALESAELADRANDICREYSQRAQALGQPDLTDAAAAQEYFAAAEELARGQQDELEALTPADDLAADFERLVAANAKATVLLAELAETSPEADQQRYAELVNGLEPLRVEVDESATAVDAGECAG